MLIKIPFRLASKPPIEIEIPDSTEERFRLRASLTIAVKMRADLTDIDLIGADLSGAALACANLTRAVLAYADLTGAVLTGADLTGALLTGTVFTGADFTGADLTAIRADVFDILRRTIPEIPGLLLALREGRVDGSVYSGKCACFIGTIAKVAHTSVFGPRFNFRNPSRPAERWFTGIKEGDTPANNIVSKIAEGWIVEFQQQIKQAQPSTETGK